MTVFQFTDVINLAQMAAYPYTDVPKAVMVLRVEREE